MNDLSHEEKPPGTIKNAILGIRWAHLRKGYTSPTDDPIVELAFKGALRIAAKYKVSNQKEPLSPEIIKKVCEKYGNSDNLIHQRFLVICILGYFGFLRISEVLKVQVKQINFGPGYINIILDKSKKTSFVKGTRFQLQIMKVIHQ